MAIESLPNELRAYMVEYNLSQGALAVRAGVNPSAISLWLQAKAKPSLDNCIALARILERPFIEILEMAGHLTEQQAREAMDLPEVPGWAYRIARLSARDQQVVRGRPRARRKLVMICRDSGG